MWAARLPDWENVLSQCWHAKGFSPVCVLRRKKHILVKNTWMNRSFRTTLCGRQDYTVQKIFCHSTHTQKVFPLCVSYKKKKSIMVKKCMNQQEFKHLMCRARFERRENVLSQYWHIKGLSFACVLRIKKCIIVKSIEEPSTGAYRDHLMCIIRLPLLSNLLSQYLHLKC